MAYSKTCLDAVTTALRPEMCINPNQGTEGTISLAVDACRTDYYGLYTSNQREGGRKRERERGCVCGGREREREGERERERERDI